MHPSCNIAHVADLPWQAMEVDVSGGGLAAVVRPDPEKQEAVVRENVPDPLAGEQTWPTEHVRGMPPMLDHISFLFFVIRTNALGEPRTNALGEPSTCCEPLQRGDFLLCSVSGPFGVPRRLCAPSNPCRPCRGEGFDWRCDAGQHLEPSRLRCMRPAQEMAEAEAVGRKRRRLPKGTSEYQAAWILDDDEGGADDLLGPVSEGEEDEQEQEQGGEGTGLGDDTASLLGSGGLGSRTVGGETDVWDDEGPDQMEVCPLCDLGSLQDGACLGGEVQLNATGLLSTPELFADTSESASVACRRMRAMRVQRQPLN